ncbi:MAG TPA: DUF1566 domain-containing protein [Parafilimonas sp.]|nr:DUF1566 domain-containing protein [Parafilimonas sp.]
MTKEITVALAAISLLMSCEKQTVENRTPATRSADNSVAIKYHVGDTVGGGIVFYVDSTKLHGLVAAFKNQGQTTWDNDSFVVTGATGTAIGTGALNTKKIISIQKIGPYAATLCTSYRGGGYADWFLPSKDELAKLYLNKSAFTGFTQFYYWSSTEVDSTKAWAQSFYNGSQTKKSKGGRFYVRAVRAF